MKNLRTLDWEKMDGMIPAVVQHAVNGEVLMVGYMNPASLKKTVSTRKVWFYSRSKKRLWMKGEQSGHILRLQEIRVDCDGDALLVKARPVGPTCHTGARTCFGGDEPLATTLTELYDVIQVRKRRPSPGSYTSQLFKEGLKKILAKVAEEGREVVKAGRQETRQRLVEESVDVFYHLMVLWAQRGVTLKQVAGEIKKRRK